MKHFRWWYKINLALYLFFVYKTNCRSSICDCAYLFCFTFKELCAVIKECDRDSYWDKSKCLLIEQSNYWLAILSEYSHIFKLIRAYKTFCCSHVFVAFASKVLSIALPLLCYLVLWLEQDKCSSKRQALLLLCSFWNYCEIGPNAKERVQHTKPQACRNSTMCCQLWERQKAYFQNLVNRLMLLLGKDLPFYTSEGR